MKGTAYPIVTIGIIFTLVGFLYYNFVTRMPDTPVEQSTVNKPGNPIDPIMYSPREELALTASRLSELERELDRKTRALEKAISENEPKRDDKALIASLRADFERELDKIRRQQAEPRFQPAPEIEINSAISPGDVYSLVSVPPLGESESDNLLGNLSERVNNAYNGTIDRARSIGNEGSRLIERSTGITVAPEVTPYYTINIGATLFEATALSPIIGRVPKIETQADTPFRFKVIASPESFAASGLTVPPEVANTIWLGWAVGVAENSCVRGWVDTMTFIFHDGRIVTQGKPTRSAKNAGSRALGYIGDQWNTPCVTGQYINNASDYLGTRLIASGLESLGDVWRDTQYTNRSRFDGVESYFTGDTSEAIAAGVLSGSAGELADYARERQLNAVDIVVLPLGSKVSINIEQEIVIDYNNANRKLRYDQTFSRTKHRGFD